MLMDRKHHGQNVGKINCVNGSMHWEVRDNEVGMTGGKFYFGNQFSIGGVPGIEISSPKIVDLMEQLAGEVSEQKRTMIILESHYSARKKSHSSPSAYDIFCSICSLFLGSKFFQIAFSFFILCVFGVIISWIFEWIN
jgi:hypothetical protein